MADIRMERKPEPWGEAEIALLQTCMRRTRTVMDHHEVGLDPRVERAGEQIRKLGPALERGVAHVDDASWARAKEACLKASVLSECADAIGFRIKESSRHKKEAEQLTQSVHVQRLYREKVARDQQQHKEDEGHCRQCMATCRGTGAADEVCRERCWIGGVTCR